MTTFIHKRLLKRYSQIEITNLALYSAGKLVSVFGSAIYTFAIGLYVLQMTSSGLSFALTMVLGTIPLIILNPVAGVLADRTDKKILVVSMDFASGLLLLMVYFASSFIGLQLSMIYLSTFFLSAFTAVFAIGLESAKPNIVKERNLMQINSVSKIIDSVSSILGPMVGGIIYAFIDIRVFILVNGLSFIVSGLSEMYIDFSVQHGNSSQEKKKIRFFQDMKEGFSYLKDSDEMIRLIGIFVCINFFIGLSVTVPLPFMINNVLNMSSGHYGIIQGGFPVGMILGAVMVRRISDGVAHEKLITKTTELLAFLMILIGLPVLLIHSDTHAVFYLLYYSIITVTMGVLIAVIDIQSFYLIQTKIPEEYRGRVLSISIAIAKAISPVALLISGAGITQLPPSALPMAGGMALLLMTKSILNTRVIKSSHFIEPV